MSGPTRSRHNAPATSTRRIAYRTRLGRMVVGDSLGILASSYGARYRAKAQLIFTSPPFPLNRKKRYGNMQGEGYVKWLSSFSHQFKNLLAPSGSLVVELGNAWQSGQPTMSTLALKALLGLLEEGGFHLCQQFVCHNPARLPSPAQWVNVERIRVTDAFTHVWWMAPSARPKADNRRVLRDYSASMLRLLKSQKYNAGSRPSQHHIGAKSFLTNNGGAIRSNVLTFTNTAAADEYQLYCKENDLPRHPARMPGGLAEFFIAFLTEPGDLVVDPFAGSNTTGAAAERLGRKWLSIELNEHYVEGSLGRFPHLLGGRHGNR